MTHLNLILPDTLYRSLERRAKREGRSPDEFILRSLEQTLADENEDPLLQVLGTLKAETSDLGERHDTYLAQAHSDLGE